MNLKFQAWAWIAFFCLVSVGKEASSNPVGRHEVSTEPPGIVSISNPRPGKPFTLGLM
jgi:hypothetical protein